MLRYALLFVLLVFAALATAFIAFASHVGYVLAALLTYGVWFVIATVATAVFLSVDVKRNQKVNQLV